jgi:glycosyltransferase involved in cell wall biosynthesis
MERLAEDRGVSSRVTFLGAVSDDMVVDLYADALAVAYPPYDEDFGYVTLEAFLARKPVVTATDSGGPLEFVDDGINGFVSLPVPEALADRINTLAGNPGLAARQGAAGYDKARAVTWDGVIERLVGGL